MKRPRILAALLLLLAGTAVSAVPEADPPLTNEDVVRMAASGRSEPDILRVIAASPVDFDLERDMLEELRRAGLSERVLAAMRERQAVAGSHPPAAPLPARPEPPRGTLELSFVPLGEPAGKEAPSFRMVKKIPRWAVQRMDMEEKAEVEDLAWFVACATPEHVPDHWQDRSPVRELRRHEMLRFLPGSRSEKAKGFEMLALALPEALDLAVPEGTHFLVIGVAAKIGPDWRPVASAERRDVPIAPGRTTRIVVGAKGRLAGSAMKGFKEEQGVSIVEVRPPGERP